MPIDPPPIASLAPEILSKIFLLALSTPRHLDSDNDPNVHPGLTPLFLGSICRSWRDIAWLTPTLWCSFTVMITPNQTQKALLEQWINRANGLLLSIAVRVGIVDARAKGGEEIQVMNSMFEILVAHSVQWRFIDLDIPLTTSLERILSRVEHHVPNLTSLALKPAFMLHSEGLDHLKLHMFQDAPSLKELYIAMFFLSDFNLKWTQLTALRVELERQECLEALRLCSETLIECSMECFSGYSDPDEWGELTPVVAVRLTKLDVTNYQFGNDTAFAFYSILPFMTFPALRELSIPIDSVDNLGQLNEMLSRSSFPELEVLTLSSLNRFNKEVQNGETKVLDFIAGIPSLIKVHLIGKEDFFLTNSFIDMLHPLHRRMRDKESPAVILPNLRVFKYEGRVKVDVASLIDMLSYRWKRPQALADDMAQLASATFKAFGGFKLSEDNASAIKSLVGEGVDLKLKNYRDKD